MAPLFECAWMDSVFGLCGADPDELFGFKTKKEVKIKDRVLGCFAKILTLVILILILVDLFLSYRYMRIVSPSGTAQANVLPPPFTVNDLNSQTTCDTRSPMTNLTFPYCITDGAGQPSAVGATRIKMPCVWWESGRYMTPGNAPESVFITTRLKEQTYTVPCDASYTSGSQTFNAVDPSCVVTASNAGGYPTYSQSFKGFVAGADDTTIKIEHTMSAEWAKVHFDGTSAGTQRTMKGMNGWLVDCNGNKVRNLPKQGSTDFWCDLYNNRLFKLKELLSVASMGIEGTDTWQCGLELDDAQLQELALADEPACRGKNLISGTYNAATCTETYRYTGLVLLLRISYNNLYEHSTASAEPEYSITVTAQANSDAESERVSFKQGTSPGTVTMESRRGVLVLLQQEGSLGHFSWKQCLIELAAALGLLAVANVITVLTSKVICAKITKDSRYKDALVEETDDFNPTPVGGRKRDKGEEGDTEENPDPLQMSKTQVSGDVAAGNNTQPYEADPGV